MDRLWIIWKRPDAGEAVGLYRSYHSTETVLLDILSDVCAAADGGQVTLLGLLDCSAAFDTIDHQILFDRLHHSFGFSGSVLGWMKSYLTNRTQAVHYNGGFSSTTAVTCGIPQGSVLGPLAYILYSAGVLQIIEKHGFKAHAYADDLQIFDSAVSHQSPTLVSRLSNCVDDINSWMASNRLCLNPSKTELIWLGSSYHLQRCSMEPQLISGEWIRPTSKVRDLGVLIDSDLSMSTHVNNIVNTCYFHIRQLRLVRRSLTLESTEALVRAFIHSRLDYCNGTLTGLPDYAYKRLQSVMRSAARLVLRLPSSGSVTTAMRRDLHWLSFPQRITYKLCVLAFKCLHGHVPKYLERYCTLTSSVVGRSHLRSASTNMLTVPKTHTVTMEARGFYCACPIAWNSLPAYLRLVPTFEAFKKQLKTHLFRLM